jgi:hypothetical protein
MPVFVIGQAFSKAAFRAISPSLFGAIGTFTLRAFGSSSIFRITGRRGQGITFGPGFGRTRTPTPIV